MYLFILVLGLLIGSFLNVCIWRIPRRESIVYPGSHCPKCNTTLKPMDLIPVFSFLVYRGKCRYCDVKISMQYPIIELMHAMIYLFLYYRYGYSLEFMEYALLSSLIIVISFIDIDHQIIPDGLIWLGFVFAFIFNIHSFFVNFTNLYNSVLGLLIGGGFFLLIALITNGGMGGGDIKLMGMLGFWLRWKWILLIMFLSFVIGAFISVCLIITKQKGRKDMIPFGPFIGFATLMTVYYGNDIIYYYITYFYNIG
ncbi:prepilin peptidase [Crassaminicella profunda]|uniref:prepilin peptidase n=1 Tax=Crassaminicella profunda TaxID=1286698 RepID=UPI001CA69C85|nr:A24 family peptidase [Crassaminicella profunda]QZY56981.1 prepilin peptidase [Crassaminicella profunda]